MPKGRTGYEILKSWVTGEKNVPVEKQYTNPLDAKIGSHVRISSMDGFDQDLWRVTELWAWNRNINGNIHPMTDYILESENKRVILRVLPKTTKGKKDDPDLLLLTQYWPEQPGAYPWGEESPFVLDGLMDPAGEFVRFGGTEQEEKYFRDLSNIKSDVSIISDRNNDSIIENEEVQKGEFSLWTFRRVTNDEANQEFEQHLHVQLSGIYDPRSKKVSGGDKDILILRGESVPTMNVMMY